LVSRIQDFRKITGNAASTALLLLAVSAVLQTQAQTQSPNPNPPQPTTYKPTVASLDEHPLPQWYDDAKLGVMVVWGLYSVPGWAPLSHPEHDFASTDFIRNSPYAEWYYNVSRIEGTPTYAYNREHYGAAHNYYDFAADFSRESRAWSPDKMAAIFKDAGIRYVVFSTKFHDGYGMWPSAVPNPNQRDVNFQRDYMGELTAAVEKSGMRMGIYYSGGFDWTFNRGPIETNPDYDAVKPETVAYGTYADAQIKELIDRYHPAVLWNDIDWPRSGDALADMAYYYNAVPDGVVDDRYGVPHADFNTKEYTRFDEIQPKKWEANRGLGQSFGYNRAEGEANTIAPAELIALLADVVSKNGNLLLGIGPEADGSIAPVQMERLAALGAWMKQNGEAIYGTRPWTRATGETADGQQVRFTQKAGALYAILVGAPKSASVVIRNLKAQAGSAVELLGEAKPLAWKQQGADLEVELPATLPGKYAYVLRLSQ